MSILNRQVLCLNVSYEPVHIGSARWAIKLVCKGSAEVLAVSKLVAHTDKMDIPIPDVIRLKRYIRVPRSSRSVSRRGILLRDNYQCQYCGESMPASDLTLDHVIPRSRGGENTWSNLVTCCFPDNNRKSNRTPAEAGMKLLSTPRQIGILAKTRLLRGDSAVWDKYIFT